MSKQESKPKASNVSFPFNTEEKTEDSGLLRWLSTETRLQLTRTRVQSSKYEMESCPLISTPVTYLHRHTHSSVHTHTTESREARALPPILLQPGLFTSPLHLCASLPVLAASPLVPQGSQNLGSSGTILRFSKSPGEVPWQVEALSQQDSLEHRCECLCLGRGLPGLSMQLPSWSPRQISRAAGLSIHIAI